MCVGRVVSRIEARATYGFRCLLGGRRHVYFPKLGGMSLDTKERQKYFGLRSQRACGFCRFRNGRSAARVGRRQDQHLLNLLHGWAHSDAQGPGSAVRKRQRAQARAKLYRHGWDYKKPCRLNEFASACLVHIPQFGPVPYAGLIHFERLHVFFINFCDYAMKNLVKLVTDEFFSFARSMVHACQQFRDPITGVTHPRLGSVLKMTHLTAERRVKAIFYWAHILGTKAEIVCEPCRTHAQVLVSSLQLLLIATRGRRAYTEVELDVIFTEVGRQFFTSLEAIAEYHEQQRMAIGRAAHERNPTRVQVPVPFKRLKRCENESATDSTDSEATWGGIGEFEYSQKGLPHALQHVKEQVMRGGHHDAFCSTVNEAGHIHFIKLAAKFSRKYASLNQSEEGMLNWVNRQKVWSEAVRLAKVGVQLVSLPVSPPHGSPNNKHMVKKLGTPLPYTEGWQDASYVIRNGKPSAWGSRLFSPKVRVTRHELLTLVCTQLGTENPTRTDISRILSTLHFQCYGTLKTTDPNRTFVGINHAQPRRRDFVILCGLDKDKTTCLSVHVIMFVKVSGFSKDPPGDGLALPLALRHPQSNYENVVFALIRWLSPHPDATLRDRALRPICTSPFDINHALWKFSKLESRRVSFNPAGTAITSQLHRFDGNDDTTRLACVEKEAFDYYDLIEVESLSTFMNCTRVNLDQNDIMETITFPFHDADTCNFI